MLFNHDTAVARNHNVERLFLAKFHHLFAAHKFSIVAIYTDLRADWKHVEREAFPQGLLLGIDAYNVPFVAMPAGHDDILAGISVNEAGVVPGRGYILHKVDGPRWSIGHVVGSQGKMLHGRLEKHGGGKGEHIGGDAMSSGLVVAIIILVERASAKIHAAYGIAYKRMDAGIAGLGITHALGEMHVFTG